MKVKIIGARALNPIKSKVIRKHASARFAAGGEIAQIDIGNDFKGRADYLLITHLHSDHVGKISTLPFDTEIFVPHKTFREFIKIEINRPVNLFKPRTFVRVGNFEILAFPVNHSKNTKTFGYLIKSKGKLCLWLPDFRNLRHCLKYFKNLAALFVDASCWERNINIGKGNNYGHLSIINTLRALKRNHLKPRKIYFIHLGKQLMPLPVKVEILRAMFPDFDLQAAVDGQTIKI